MSDSEVIVQFRDLNNVSLGPSTTVPVSLTRDQIEELVNTLIKSEGNDDHLETSKYTFILENSEEIKDTLEQAISNAKDGYTGETILNITYIPISIYNIRPVTRCASSLQGHSEAVLCLEFSPDGSYLASGSGDSTVRIWDLSTHTPIKTFTGHTNWVLSLSWSPDGHSLASAGMDNKVIVWNPKNGGNVFLGGHTKGITTLAWQPLHNIDTSVRNYPLLASASMDCTVRIWDSKAGVSLKILSGHTRGISQIIWSADDPNMIFSASRDTFIKVWNFNTGALVKNLKGHAHWINTLTSNTSRIMKSGPYSPENFEIGNIKFGSVEEMIKESRKIYQKFRESFGQERLLSGSDDNTMFIWLPHSDGNKPLYRMTGHQQLINHVSFSADGRYFASASFDKSIRIWCSITGKYLRTLRGHCGRVYRISWSCRGNYIVSASSDSTLKLWDAETGKLKFDLPGHADEVYTLDWSNCGRNVASGGKDKIVKLWCH
ncbi:WD-repeat domain-containing protein [Theileria equi strain WA]|uniref:WD-repeat domain-containing protein n=1 Tax=Theileria equi strain WA TaxID=1537102 RepID=L0B1L3_THEEQ|nr:WD-repeat domain-containing protein [Theileria equi strain WA]AFZ81141.1 WD-repeat domain-containing protein [Theileria equi strain WA]|eukprot:XP_004830807.1 WD-repeat domain-containing protein [Theileria equi strain WA]